MKRLAPEAGHDPEEAYEYEIPDGFAEEEQDAVQAEVEVDAGIIELGEEDCDLLFL